MASYADCRGQVGRAEESDDEKTMNESESGRRRGLQNLKFAVSPKRVNSKIETKMGTKSDWNLER